MVNNQWRQEAEMTAPIPGRLNLLRQKYSHDSSLDYRSEWSVDQTDDRFIWLRDRKKGIVMLDQVDCQFELRCHGPTSSCPPSIVPKHYHTPAYEGIRVIYCWRVGSLGLKEVSKRTTFHVVEDGIQFSCHQLYHDGTRTKSDCLLRYESEWGAYSVEVTSEIFARKVDTPLEYCNLLPAGIGDSRKEFERFPYTFWSSKDSVMKMGKNPLWFNSVEAQDLNGSKRITDGGFLGFGPDARLNPVIEIVHSDPISGAMTCDNLQDEHIMTTCPTGENARSGWFHLKSDYRIFSLTEEFASRVLEDAEDLRPSSFLAWKFQYPAIPELPDNLAKTELPGSVFYGKSDWSKPVPWNETFNGNVWTASTDEHAAIYWDRQTGCGKPGSIRLRVRDEPIVFSPSTGHTLHLRERRKYHLSAWIKTEGQASGWIDVREMLFTPWQNTISHCTERIPGDRDWIKVETELESKGEDYPFATIMLNADGHGSVWFSELAFEEI